MTHEATLAALLDSHGAALHRIARAYAGALGEEEDLYQEILLQLWRSLPGYRGESARGTWAYRVALNTALTWRRRSARRGSRGARRPTGEATPPETRSEASILANFLSFLGRVDHTVLLLYMEGLPHQEIAEVTGLSVSAVSVRLHRMKKAFQRRYMER